MLEISKTVSHYRIIGKPSDGMGIVYKADETKLKRAVTLKFLSDELSKAAHPALQLTWSGVWKRSLFHAFH